MLTYFEMFSVVLVNNGKKYADKYIHADDEVNNEIQRIPVIPIVCWNSATQRKQISSCTKRGYRCSAGDTFENAEKTIAKNIRYCFERMIDT